MTRLLTLIVLLQFLGCAATPTAAKSAPPDDAVVRDLEEQERLGVLNRDRATLERLWAESFFVNNPMNRISGNRAEVLDLMQRGAIHYSRFERRIEQLRVFGDLAVVMGGETIQPVGSSAAPVQRRFTHIWQREAGSWRLVARHANNVLPAGG